MKWCANHQNVKKKPPVAIAGGNKKTVLRFAGRTTGDQEDSDTWLQLVEPGPGGQHEAGNNYGVHDFQTCVVSHQIR